MRLDSLYQKRLTERDSGVKLDLYMYASDLAKIQNELEFEQVRHAHLGRLWAGYRARIPTYN